MRIAVGATGNVGAGVLRSLVDDPRVASIVAIARRLPDIRLDKVTWARADGSEDDPSPWLAGVDVAPSIEALGELVAGLQAGAGYPTQVLESALGASRVKELLTGLGKRGP
jgi:uncharacterized protein YbjT (DUF2867 family)